MQSVPFIPELQSKYNPCKSFFCEQYIVTNLAAQIAPFTQMTPSQIFSSTDRLFRIVRSSRGWLATGPKFKLHPRTESLTRVGARPRHYAGANFSQVLRCLTDGKLGWYTRALLRDTSHFWMLEKARGGILRGFFELIKMDCLS